jgi:hypothetical protein
VSHYVRIALCYSKIGNARRRDRTRGFLDGRADGNQRSDLRIPDARLQAWLDTTWILVSLVSSDHHYRPRHRPSLLVQMPWRHKSRGSHLLRIESKSDASRRVLALGYGACTVKVAVRLNYCALDDDGCRLPGTASLEKELPKPDWYCGECQHALWEN